jgi:hypothetical protein
MTADMRHVPGGAALNADDLLNLDKLDFEHWRVRGLFYTGAGGTTASSFGWTITGISTLGAKTLASSSFDAQIAYAGYHTSNVVSNSSNGAYSSNFCWLGGIAQGSGFKNSWRFIHDGSLGNGSTRRVFIGMRDNTAAPSSTADPSALLNMFGIGIDSGETNFQLMCNDGSGTATKIDLGLNFPAKGTTSKVYEFFLEATPGETVVKWVLDNKSDDMTVSGVIDTDIPATTVPLGMISWVNNGSAAATLQSLGACQMIGKTRY